MSLKYHDDTKESPQLKNPKIGQIRSNLSKKASAEAAAVVIVEIPPLEVAVVQRGRSTVGSYLR